MQARRATKVPPPDPTYTDEIRLGRNFIRSGDTVKVRPSKEGKRDGFKAIFKRAKLDDNGDVKWVDVIGGAHDRRQERSLRLDRIQRVAQTRQGESLGRAR